jgi:hypothetical protein
MAAIAVVLIIAGLLGGVAILQARRHAGSKSPAIELSIDRHA